MWPGGQSLVYLAANLGIIRAFIECYLPCDPPPTSDCTGIGTITPGGIQTGATNQRCNAGSAWCITLIVIPSEDPGLHNVTKNDVRTCMAPAAAQVEPFKTLTAKVTGTTTRACRQGKMTDQLYEKYASFLDYTTRTAPSSVLCVCKEENCNGAPGREVLKYPYYPGDMSAAQPVDPGAGGGGGGGGGSGSSGTGDKAGGSSTTGASTTTKSPAGGSGNTWIIVGVIVGLMVLLAVGLGIGVYQKRKKDKEEEQPEEEVASSGGSAEE